MRSFGNILKIMNQSPKLEPVASSSGEPITPLVFSQPDTSSTTNKTKQSLSEFVAQLDNYTSTVCIFFLYLCIIEIML
ncbi:hypothetical protein TNCT_620961 [Trichonephila clavata]|uniref:Uncharacterized protein n=1 Tax=Trichonephila clavata TaxID=2740835 RepID=A0A8X6I497_TRICU|nr:hypothetical protein TNCT_620961 [Trichonephila clavata]